MVVRVTIRSAQGIGDYILVKQTNKQTNKLHFVTSKQTNKQDNTLVSFRALTLPILYNTYSVLVYTKIL